MTGTIKNTKNVGKGFLFVKGDDGVDYFAHHSESATKLEKFGEGQQVEFDAAPGAKGPRAQNLRDAARSTAA